MHVIIRKLNFFHCVALKFYSSFIWNVECSSLVVQECLFDLKFCFLYLYLFSRKCKHAPLGILMQKGQNVISKLQTEWEGRCIKVMYFEECQFWKVPGFCLISTNILTLSLEDFYFERKEIEMKLPE